jgi:hypothetical protein
MTKIVPNSLKFAGAEELDVNLISRLENHFGKLPPEEIISIISEYDIYLKEKNSSSCVRVNGELSIIASNVLAVPKDEKYGKYGYENVIETQKKDDITGQFKYKLEEVLFNDNGFYYYIDPDNEEEPCNRVELDGRRFRFYPNNEDEWSVILTYIKGKNIRPIFFNEINITEGIAIMEARPITVAAKKMSLIFSPIKHNLNIGDNINIYNNSGFVGNFYIYKLGTEDGTYTDNAAVLDGDIVDFFGVLTNEYRFKKVINGVESEYYSRWLKKYPAKPDVFKSGFAKNVFTDKNFSYVYGEDIDVTNLFDYLLRPVTSFYTTLIKKKGKDNFWSTVLSGLDTFYTYMEYDLNTINHSTQTFALQNNVQESDEYFILDVVEYNTELLYETTLCNAGYIFNAQERIDYGYMESYYYYPHKELKFRNLSDTITFQNSQNIPPIYAVDSVSGKKWRNIAVLNDVPFLNGCNYLRGSHNFFVKRQDPFGEYLIDAEPLIKGKPIKKLAVQPPKEPDEIC